MHCKQFPHCRSSTWQTLYAQTCLHCYILPWYPHFTDVTCILPHLQLLPPPSPCSHNHHHPQALNACQVHGTTHRQFENLPSQLKLACASSWSKMAFAWPSRARSPCMTPPTPPSPITARCTSPAVSTVERLDSSCLRVARSSRSSPSSSLDC